MNTVTILGLQVSRTDAQGMFDQVGAWSRQERPRSILYLNAHCANLAEGDPDYKSILNQADLVFADGISVVWAARLLQGVELQKLTCADWIYDFAAWAEARGRSSSGALRLYLLGGRPGVAARAAAHLHELYPTLEIVGIADGYFREKSEAQVLLEIERAAPHVVFVGMGTPLQEKWIAARRERLAAPVCWAVGAMFDYLAGEEARVPDWLYRLGLEWFWRLLVDPLGKWRRYLLGNPWFVYRVLRQKFLPART